LKRSFVFDRDIGCVVAPLDKSSFHKMMTARLPKDDMADEAHAVCVIETAQVNTSSMGEKFLWRGNYFFVNLLPTSALGPGCKTARFRITTN